VILSENLITLCNTGQILVMAVAAGRPELWGDGSSALLSPTALRPAFQPVVDLDNGAVVGFEALARVGPGLPALPPAEMFAWARRAGEVSALDWSCRCAAFRSASAAGIRPPLAVLVNAEPVALDSGAPPALAPDVRQARRELRVIIELTERQLAQEPVRLFRVVDTMRALGWGLALDDVGAEPASLALLPLLQPDVIKLDRAVLLDPTAAGHAATVHAVAAEAERTGAVIVAEGIETWRQAAMARALGAHYGQGFLWGRPTPVPDVDLPTSTLPTRPPAPARAGRAQTEAGERADRPRVHGTAELTAHIEMLFALAERDGAGVLLTDWPDPAVAARWAHRLRHAASRCAFVGSTFAARSGLPRLGVGYEFVVLGPAAAATMVARPTDTPEAWVVSASYRREAAIAAGQRLIRRTTPVIASPVVPGPRTDEQLPSRVQHL